MRIRMAAWLVALAMLAAWGVAEPAAQQAPGRAQQDEFVPVDRLPSQEELPAAPLVMIAYAAAWLILLAYLWSIWQRIGRVERELADVTRRVQQGGSAGWRPPGPERTSRAPEPGGGGGGT